MVFSMDSIKLFSKCLPSSATAEQIQSDRWERRGRGWRRGRWRSHRTVTQARGRQRLNMFVIYRRDALLLFQDFHHCRCIFLPQKVENACFYCLEGCVNACWVPSLHYCIFSLLCISPCLINSDVPAEGGHQGDQYASCLALPHSISNCLNNMPPFLFPNSVPISSSCAFSLF